MEALKFASTLISTVVALMTFITLVSTRFRTKITGFFKERNDRVDEINNTQDERIENIEANLKVISEDNRLVKEFMRQQCRDHIKNVFYRYRNTQVIPYYEWQSMDAAYKIYHDGLKYNHDITCLYEQISKWQIDCSEKLGDD